MINHFKAEFYKLRHSKILITKKIICRTTAKEKKPS